MPALPVRSANPIRRAGSRLALAALAIACLSIGAAGAASDKGAKKLDMIWTHPDFASLPIKSIAMLPAASYNNDLKTEKEIEVAWGQAFRPTGYRWFSSTLSKELLKSAFGGDSVLTALRTKLLKEPRVDSLSAPALCRALRTSAVLTVRADLWERTEMEWNQTGKPWTTVQLKAAIVDSSGRLLWSAAGSETAEGAMHSADNNTLGVKSSGLTLTPVTGQGGAPSFQEVLSRLLGRWIERFPVKAAPAAPTATPPAGGGS